MLVFCGLHGILALAFHHGLQGSRGVHAPSVEHLLLRPWCVLCCSPVFLFPALLPVGHCGWLFLNCVSFKVPLFWLKSSAMPCHGSFWSQMEPHVSASGQPQPLLTKATPLPTHWHGHPVQSSTVQYIQYSTVKTFLKVGKEACNFMCTPNPHFC